MRERESKPSLKQHYCTVFSWKHWAGSNKMASLSYPGMKPNKRHKPPHSVATVQKSTYTYAFSTSVGKETVLLTIVRERSAASSFGLSVFCRVSFYWMLLENVDLQEFVTSSVCMYVSNCTNRYLKLLTNRLLWSLSIPLANWELGWIFTFRIYCYRLCQQTSLHDVTKITKSYKLFFWSSGRSCWPTIFCNIWVSISQLCIKKKTYLIIILKK